MSEEWQKYIKDSRMVCKYGTKCYQRNPEHHKAFKHPPHSSKHKVESDRNKNRFSPYRKNKTKTNTDSNTKPSDNNARKDAEPDTSTSKSDSPTKQDPAESSIDIHIAKHAIKLPDNLQMYDSCADPKLYQELFLMDMPPDFFKLYECLKQEDQPIEKILANVNLQLIGPYDLLLGNLPILDDKELYLIHWRFFYDPPEFQAVIKAKGKSEYHIGYYRDDPNDKPIFLASNDSSKDCLLKPIADNIFAAVYFFLQNEKKRSPFLSIACQKLMEKFKKWAETHDFPLEEYDMKKRQSQIVTKTLHGAGIVVPYDKKTQLGYRSLTETDASIKKMFTRLQAATSQTEKDTILSELQPLITYANIAVDECDFGTGLELGIDLFCSGLKELQPSALSSLCTAYSLLNRDAFSKIIQAHIKYRRKGPDMSLLSASEK